MMMMMTSSRTHHLLICTMQDFFQKACWAHHPKPYADFMEYKKKEEADQLADRQKLIPGM